ncbi:CDP-diacylglycerol--serine O-phosphatidyltransferase [Proteinivorax hydrogeniformans]|uniref:CDP-diacylglycerol--serine O-phosphatidyltransferase n=1 Tax=Proteinivorax hydrogeniformans TaxID=1826727 RepID=A0AAU8HTE4_9FIRM
MFKRIVPSLFTLGNLVFGLIALLYIINGDPARGSAFILVGMLLDGLDGKVARFLGVSSEFGKQLDSLSDMVTFGVAPAFLTYELALEIYGIYGLAICFAFPIAGAIRLARFNVIAEETPSGFFIGMPITIAGGILTIVVLFDIFPQLFVLGAVLFLAYMMISSTKYPDFKTVGIPKWAQLLLVLVILLIVFYFKIPELIFLPITIYILLGLKERLETILQWYKRKRVCRSE